MDKTLDLDELERVARERLDAAGKSGHFGKGGLEYSVWVTQQEAAMRRFINVFTPHVALTLIAAARPAETLSEPDQRARGETGYATLHDLGLVGPSAEACEWPKGMTFGFHDEPGEHDPCYVIMPNGSMLAFNHDARPGVDIARARFVQAACNGALAAARPAVVSDEVVDLTADFARGLPGGKLDDSDYEAIESALDRADAPCQGSDGHWLTLAERVAALALLPGGEGKGSSRSLPSQTAQEPPSPTPCDLEGK